MITKGIIEEIVAKYRAKVRLPIYEGMPQSSDVYVRSNDLSTATICTLPSCEPNFQKGDVVFVAFEDNDLGKTIILGMLYCESSKKSTSSLGLNSLVVDVDTHLSEATTIGDVASDDIQNLKGTKGNIQKQIDEIQIQINQSNDMYSVPPI